MKYLFLFLLFLSTSLFANIGKITAIKGDASIIRGAKILIPKTGFIIEKNDNITTKANARLQVVFNDNTIISLGKNTTFSINDYFYDEQQPKKTKASFKVARGIFKTITGRIGKINPNKFKLKTKSASIGIRGTVFFGETSNGKDSISCTQGQIVVITSLGIVEVKAGEITKVESGKPPSTPTPLSNEEKGTLEKDSGAQENEQESGQTEGVANQQPQEENQEDSGDSAQNDEGQDEGTPNQPNEGEPTPPQTPPKPDTPPSFIPEPPSYDPNDLGPNNDPTPPSNPIIPPSNPTPPDTDTKIPSDISTATKTATYYSMHTAYSELTYNAQDNGLIGLQDDNILKKRDGYSPVYKIDKGIITIVDQLKKFKFESGSYTLIANSEKDYSKTNDLSDTTFTPTYSGFKLVKQNYEDHDANSNTPDILVGAVFSDSKKEFFVQEIHLNPMLNVMGDETFNTNDANKKFDYTRTVVYGERTQWSNVESLSGVSTYLLPYWKADLYSTSAYETMTYDPNEVSNNQFIYGTQGIKVNWTNRTFIYFDMERLSTSILIGNIIEENGYARLVFNSLDQTININNYNNLSTIKIDTNGDNEGYLFGSEYQGLGITMWEEQGANKRVQTHGAYRSPTTPISTTNYTTQSMTGFASAGDYIRPLSIDFTAAGFTGRIGIDSTDNNILFGGNYSAQHAAFITPDIFAALNFNGNFNGQNSGNSVDDGTIISINHGTTIDDEISWGIWSVDTIDSDIGRDFWVGTTKDIVNNLSTSTPTASYSGQAMGWIGDYNTGTFIDPTNSTINFTLDFASTTSTATLNVGGVTPTSFTFNASAITSISGSENNQFEFSGNIGSDTDNQSKINGSLYDSGATSIGSFRFVDDPTIARGVYKATKQ